MSKLLLISGLGIILLVFGIFFFTNQDSDDVIVAPSNEVSIEQIGIVSPQPGGAYSVFSPAILVDSTSSRRVLFFFANWCPTCLLADLEFTEGVSKLPEDLTLIKVNYNDTETDEAEKALARQYNIVYQHTFVQIDNLGNEIFKWNGGQMTELLSNLR